MKKDIFKSDCQAIVNPVNCVGVMGAGLAKAFKEKYPEVFETYLKACNQTDMSKKLRIGTCLTVRANDGKFIINLPTKDHFKNPSKMEYVEKGVDALIRNILHFDIKSVAIPALGAGLGGLNWKDVKEVISNKMNNLTLKDGTRVEIELYDPVPFVRKQIDKNDLER